MKTLLTFLCALLLGLTSCSKAPLSSENRSDSYTMTFEATPDEQVVDYAAQVSRDGINWEDVAVVMAGPELGMTKAYSIDLPPQPPSLHLYGRVKGETWTGPYYSDVQLIY